MTVHDEAMKGANGQAVEILEIGGRHIEVDVEIADLVHVLNQNGYATRASCSGHGFRPADIVLADGREIIIARNHVEGRQISRLFPLDINGTPIAPVQDDDAELIVRLRAHAVNFDALGLEGFAGLCGEAADRIERLSQSTEEGVLRWLGENNRLSLEHYSPVYCDDPDQSEEWRVIEQRGSINDREYNMVGRGETPLEALIEARAALAGKSGEGG